MIFRENHTKNNIDNTVICEEQGGKIVGPCMMTFSQILSEHTKIQ